MWPFRRRTRLQKTLQEQLGELKLERERLKLSVGRRIAEDNPDLAAALLLGGARGAQAFVTREKSLAERFFEKKILSDDFDGLDKLERVRRLIREERDEMDLEETPGPSPLERTVQTFLPVIAAVLNPAGFQAVMAPQQPQPGQVQISETTIAAANPGPVLLPQPVAAANPQLSPAAPPSVTLEPDLSGGTVYPFPVRAATVLANLEGMPPDAFANWALGQPALSGHLQTLAGMPDQHLASMLAQAETNPFLGEYGQVFLWLRANPERTTAVLEALRARTTSLAVEEDVAI
jgi:hypothetical protein